MARPEHYLTAGGVISALISGLHIILALISAIWAIRAFSGAGLIGPLPLMRTALIAIAAVYILRACLFPPR